MLRRNRSRMGSAEEAQRSAEVAKYEHRVEIAKFKTQLLAEAMLKIRVACGLDDGTGKVPASTKYAILIAVGVMTDFGKITSLLQALLGAQ
ncbi:hypothetical protein NE235_02435 [Actinoallomurus spadix]|uniref:Transposase n=1 Tax=Actinoallomurus spadix TaxID=79912 RepID=A0ABN0XJQ5_9ACTN|nr:hypothetical protein [Actinoallomurus spadix]MCO5984959.1 hypothetical protein [Actinoallomurus spadix]